MKHTWQLINNVIHDNFGHSKSSSVDELSCNSSILTDPVNIANKFNEYFTHTGPNLAAKIPQVSGSHLDYVKTNVKLESALCGDANPRRLQRESCCG